jgi:hypothetical protein
MAASSVCVWIKLALTDDSFTRVYFEPGEVPDAGKVAEKACERFPRWSLDAGQVRIHLVAQPRIEEPETSEISAALSNPHLSVTSVIAAGSWVVAKQITSSVEGGGGSPSDLAAAVAALSLKSKELTEELRAARIASEWLIPPPTRDMAPSVVFKVLKEGAPVGCGFFVSQTLAFTVSHNIHDNDLVSGFTGCTLSGHEFVFGIVEDLVDDDFMILEVPSRTCTDFFHVTTGSKCAELLGNQSVALLGCGIAMSDVTKNVSGAPTLGVSLTITRTDVCHVGSSNKHFGYTATTYDGDSGACLFFSSQNCVIGIHQEGVNRAKELLEQEESLMGKGGGGQGMIRIRGRLAVVADSVKSIIRDMTTGGIALFLGCSIVQEAFQRAKTRGGGGG